MEARDIFERDKLGEEISHQDPEYHKIREMIDEAQKLLFELNNKYHEEPEVRRLFSQLTGIEVDKTFRLRPRFILILERILGLVKMFLSIIVVPLWIGEELH